MQDRDRLYIDGAWTPSTGSGTIDVVNATTEEVMGRVPEGTAEDVDKAAKAACRAFETWSATTVEERAKYIQQLHVCFHISAVDTFDVTRSVLG